MLYPLLQHLEFVERQIEQLSGEIEARIRPVRRTWSLQRHPDIGRRRVGDPDRNGVEMHYRPHDEAIASWGEDPPRHKRVGGKRCSSSIGRGSQSLRSALVEAALAAIRHKDYFEVGGSRGHHHAQRAPD